VSGGGRGCNDRDEGHGTCKVVISGEGIRWGEEVSDGDEGHGQCQEVVSGEGVRWGEGVSDMARVKQFTI
jgi:hypothetical protein